MLMPFFNYLKLPGMQEEAALAVENLLERA